MVQTFNPANVLVSDTIGKEVIDAAFTQEFLSQLVATSNVVRLGQKVNMDGKMVRVDSEIGELSDAYFVGEGEKIGTASVEGVDYILEAKKVAVILPATEEALAYTWQEYFNQIIPLIVDKFNKKIDGAAFLGLHNNPFGANILAAATAAGNVLEGDLTAEDIYDLEALPTDEPNAIVGHRTIERALRGVIDTNTNEYIFERPKGNAPGNLDGLPYVSLKLANGEEYPAGTLITGNFNGLKYGVPRGSNLRLKVADQATLSTIQNVAPDTGDVHLFEQDMQALRAIFEIAVAVPQGERFAVIQPVDTP